MSNESVILLARLLQGDPDQPLGQVAAAAAADMADFHHHEPGTRMLLPLHGMTMIIVANENGRGNPRDTTRGSRDPPHEKETDPTMILECVKQEMIELLCHHHWQPHHENRLCRI